MIANKVKLRLILNSQKGSGNSKKILVYPSPFLKLFLNKATLKQLSHTNDINSVPSKRILHYKAGSDQGLFDLV